MAKSSCASAQSPTQAAPDRAIENLLSQIATTAHLAEMRLRESPGDCPELHEYEVDELRHVIARMGWMADLALNQMGSHDGVHRADPVAWLLPPSTVAALARGGQS